MSATVLKTKFEKEPAKQVHYRDYTKFNEESFRSDLRKCLPMTTSYETFEKIFLEILEFHAPSKKKFIRANEAPYMTKSLKKAIMIRSQLESKYYRTKSQIHKQEYIKQRNYCSRLYKKERRLFFQNLNIKDFLDNKKFWRNAKLLFSDKSANSKKITITKVMILFQKIQM